MYCSTLLNFVAPPVTEDGSEDKKEESVVIDKDKIQKMDIYTQEELEELDKEEESEEYSDDEDVDYDEYDEYYDK